MVSHWFRISVDSVLMQVSMNAKMADHVQKRSTSVKQNNVKIIRHQSDGYALRLRSLNIQNKQM
jgi:hypothetical protein